MVYRFDRFQVDDEAFRLSADGLTVSLEPKTLRVLLCLLRNRSRLIRKSEILDEVWQDANVTEGVLARSIGLLRKVLEDDSREPRYIETVPAAGYRFIAEVSVADRVPASAAVASPLLEREQVRPVRGRRRQWLTATAICVGATSSTRESIAARRTRRWSQRDLSVEVERSRAEPDSRDGAEP